MVRRLDAVDFWFQTEDLARPENRVTVDDEGSIRLHFVTDTNRASHDRLIEKLERLLNSLGCKDQMVPFPEHRGGTKPIAGVVHQCGTVRFGHDPATSALDVDGKMHELDYLYVVDASFFPSSGAINPTLTIIANALRIAGHLRDRLAR